MKLKLLTIGNHPPRKCGIATYTQDVCDSIQSVMGKSGLVDVLAMDDIVGGYDYPSRVKYQIFADVLADYEKTAGIINDSQYDAVMLQHEFGIFGGLSGEYAVSLIEKLDAPVITTLHSVPFAPSPKQFEIIKNLALFSDRLIALSGKALSILKDVYQINENQITQIPHGIPDISIRNAQLAKKNLSLEGRKTILTFGLLGPGKGIELMLMALPEIVKANPNALYIVLGATHPKIIEREGEAYRQRLIETTSQLGIENHVAFRNQFVSIEELCQYLSAADAYCTPYPNKEQVVSGTLAYAMSAGAAVVSTPYWHAEEMLANGRGKLVPFNDSQAMSQKISELLLNDADRFSIREKAYAYTRPMLWKNVARQHILALLEAIESCPSKSLHKRRKTKTKLRPSDENIIKFSNSNLRQQTEKEAS